MSFPTAPAVPRDVPIIGQPSILGFVPTVLMQCSCEKRSPLLAMGIGAIVQCPGCSRRFVVQGINWKSQTGQLHIEVGIVASPPQEPSKN